MDAELPLSCHNHYLVWTSAAARNGLKNNHSLMLVAAKSPSNPFISNISGQLAAMAGK